MKPWILFALTLLNLVSLPAHTADTPFAGTATKPQALSAEPGVLFTVFPRVGYANQTRTVTLITATPVCPPYTFILDTTLMQAQRQVVIQTKTELVLCPLSPYAVRRLTFEFTPTRAGTITVFWGGLPGPAIQTQSILIETLPAKVSSKFDINGMWFDTATNGSGIALHHRRTGTDTAFGTWFLYNNNGDSRWYSLQSASWQEDGNVLEGLLHEVRGTCPAASLAACPAAGAFPPPSPGNDFAVPPAVVRITFQSATRARAEVSSLAGVPLFSSDLTRLAF